MRRRDGFLTAIFFLKWPERRGILCTEEKGKENLHLSSSTREESEENARWLMVKFPWQLLVFSVNSFHQIPKTLNRWVHLYWKWSQKIIRMVVQNVLIMKRHALERDIASQTSRICLQHYARKVRNNDMVHEPVYYLCQMFPHSLLFIRLEYIAG